MPLNILAELAAPGLDHLELLTFLNRRLGGGCTIENNDVLFPCTHSYFIKVRTKGDVVQGIEPGPSFSQSRFNDLKEAVRSTLVKSTGLVTRVDILFSSKPVEAWFRAAGGQLQILPVPAIAPRPPSEIAAHPFLIEFPVRTSTDQGVTNGRAMRRALELTWTLGVLVRATISRIGPRVQHLWAIPSESEGLPVEADAKWCYEHYFIDGLPLTHTEFTPLGPAAIGEISHEVYYDRKFSSSTFMIPSTLSEMFNQRDRLCAEDHRRFIRAARWFNAATPLHLHLISSCFIALVSAIEALMPEQSPETCPSCHQDKWEVTKRFREFVERYAPSADPDGNYRKQLYRMRSDLAHGRDLLHFDSSPWDWSLSTTWAKEQEVLDALFRIAREVLVNWLRERQ